MAQTMDDMVYQCSNQNSIYVLNASYNAYGGFGPYASTKREINGSQATRQSSCSLQHKFKSFEAAPGGGVGGVSTSNYVNPVVTSMSTAMCSPAAAALQKLFNCSVACQNVSHSHNNSNNNHCNNSPASHPNNNGCLSVPGAARPRRNLAEMVESSAGAGAGALPLLSTAAASTTKKKCTNVKSTLIAKKTKFLKFLEEEKLRNGAQLTEDATTETCGVAAASNEAEPYIATTSTLVSHSGVQGTVRNSHHNGKHLKNQNNNQEPAGAEQHKLNNWSMHNDNNNKLTNYPQQQQQPKSSNTKPQTRSSAELYQEAADILGLSCSLCDNCRCLDCQSGYFDCDDNDDESYSDDEFDEYDYSVEELQMMLTTRQEQEQESNMCYTINCQQKCQQLQLGVAQDGQRVDIDFDLINATSIQVLQNCETFNDLSLLDGNGLERQVEPFT